LIYKVEIIDIQGPLNGVKAGVGSMKKVKENKKILYHFASFTIVKSY